MRTITDIVSLNELTTQDILDILKRTFESAYYIETEDLSEMMIIVDDFFYEAEQMFGKNLEQELRKYFKQ